MKKHLSAALVAGVAGVLALAGCSAADSGSGSGSGSGDSANGEQYIAVTLWRPHWAYDAYDIKDLKDPEGTLGDAEGIHGFSRDGFAKDDPQASAWLSDFTMPSDLLYSLENELYSDDSISPDEYPGIVDSWIGENQDYVDGLTDATDPAGDKKAISIAVFNGWPEGEAVSYLWQSILEDAGYDVTLEYADAAPVFLGLSEGDYDVTLDVWLPVTHASYLEQYGDKIEDLGTWNDEAKLTVAVSADAPIDSLTELADNADLFGNRIVGIEPGAGLTKAMEDNVIPTYGLDGMEFQTSSTPAMLAELDASQK